MAWPGPTPLSLALCEQGALSGPLWSSVLLSRKKERQNQTRAVSTQGTFQAGAGLIWEGRSGVGPQAEAGSLGSTELTAKPPKETPAEAQGTSSLYPS